MAEKEEIEILISDDGHLKFHIRGIKGPRCVDIAKSLANECGRIKEITYTSEYYQKEKEKREIRGLRKN
ncbi:MAG TPA: DUF2997 domain-containing protein [Firmicutes bacterium]|nr:DUF2997 domain-containing protein [Bacillota bacterium]